MCHRRRRLGVREVSSNEKKDRNRQNSWKKVAGIYEVFFFSFSPDWIHLSLKVYWKGSAAEARADR